MALSVEMVGSGSLGGVLSGWKVIEECTPAMPGDSRGSFGSASLTAWAKPDSRFVMDNEILLTSPGGPFRGRVTDVSVSASAQVSVAGPGQFLNVDKTMPPIWYDNLAPEPFGLLGTSTGNIEGNGDIAVDPNDGSVYVSAYNRCKVVKFDSDGNYVLEFGSVGSGNGQFGGGPTYLAVDPVTSNLYVCDPINSRVQRFSSTGTYQAQFGSNGSGNGQFGSAGGASTPGSIAVSPVDQAVYVVDTGTGLHRIQKFNSSGTYQAQVSTATGYADGVQAPAGITVDASNRVYASIYGGNSPYYSVVRVYNSSLVLQRDILGAFVGASSGYRDIEAVGDDFWLYQRSTNFIVKYDTNGVEVDRIYAPYAVADSTYAGYSIGAAGARVYMLARELASVPFFPNTDPRILPFEYAAIPLSSAIQRYMEACDATLDGWTLDYQATDYDVVFPGWSGNVWANLKELFAIYNVERLFDYEAKTFIIRDIGATSTTIRNHSPVETVPVNLTGGRVVDVIYQQPRAGGGVVWDAANENVPVSIDAGDTATKILYTVNHPAELAQPVPTDTLPIQPGQYYVVDSTGTHVPATTWLEAGGNITLAVGVSPGTISATLTGPRAAVSGYTGPFQFATGNDPADTPALSIVGNGTFCNPQTLVRSGSQGNPYSSPFMGTKSRALSRGHKPSQQDPNVTISFTCPVTELPEMGQAVGTLIPYEQSIYRITQIQWGNLTARVTAERHVTAGDWEDTWAGETASAYEAYWPDQGYSAGDEQVQPLRHT